MLNALRLVNGVPAPLFAERTGFALSVVARPLAVAVERGLLEADPAVLKPTELGRRFLNDLQALFLASPAPSRPATAPLVRMEATGVVR
jgi:oxygen-independent coproporphyrinogen-3 oxidase